MLYPTDPRANIYQVVIRFNIRTAESVVIDDTSKGPKANDKI